MGDKLRHRGRLTRNIVEGMIGAFRSDASIMLDDLSVIFVLGDRREPVRMKLLAGLESVTFDISSVGELDWSKATRASVVPALPTDTIEMLRKEV